HSNNIYVNLSSVHTVNPSKSVWAAPLLTEPFAKLCLFVSAPIGSCPGVIIAPQMPFASGTKLGPYEIGVPLGSGGMPEVYRDREPRSDRTCPIKILREKFSGYPVRKQRFERGAKSISSLNHPHICVLYDVGHQNGTDYLVMECVEGETLAKRLEKGPLPL